MSTHSASESVDCHGCSLTLRCIEGPQAREVFLSCKPPADMAGADLQTAAVYNAVLSTLQKEGADFGSVVTETIFLRDLRSNIAAVRSARRRVLDEDGSAQSPATTEIEQPPLQEGASLEVSLHAILPHDTTHRVELVTIKPQCDCVECERAEGLHVELGGEARFHATGLCGSGKNAYEQTHNMFSLAEKLLQQAGMEFSDVVRTWIHLREMERDYGEFNRARREFFEARQTAPVPASTAIGGGPVSQVHDLCLGIYAIKRDGAAKRTVMTSPTLNEAMQYGADFVRGMRVHEINKDALLISGTASVDESGSTAHIGDFNGQATRMLVNLAALLKEQGATFQNIVSAVTYVKHPTDAQSLRKQFNEAGFVGFPNVLVQAEVCRPDLLCETEVQAVIVLPTQID